MHTHIVAIANPKFFFIGGKPNPVTGIAMPPYRPHIPSLYFHMRQLFACCEIANFKTQQAIYSYIAQRFLPIDCERTNKVCKRANLVYKSIRFCVCYVEPRGTDVC